MLLLFLIFGKVVFFILVFLILLFDFIIKKWILMICICFVFSKKKCVILRSCMKNFKIIFYLIKYNFFEGVYYKNKCMKF